MRILIVGNGGREHALLWRLRKDLPSAEFHATRPNGGMASLAHPVEIAPTDLEALSGWAASRRVDLAVIGPEAPLAAGIADRMRKKGVPTFGPGGDAARIESSKAFAKDLLVRANVPTAPFRTFSELADAEAYVREEGAPIVIKASGLAAGKGAVVATSEGEALAALRTIMADRVFGEAGREVVVEAFMEGEELSLFGVTDGEDVVLLAPAQDHKRVDDGDSGANTGGMGAYAPVSIATPELLDEARERIFLPTLRALAEAGCPFRGLLYAGLMLTSDGLRVVEFNCRFGDPETQAVLPLLESSLLELLGTVAEGGSVSGVRLRWREGAAVATVVAAEGYPGEYATGVPIGIPREVEDAEGVHVFHAGTALRDGRLVSTGGRVLAATGMGDTLHEAAARSRWAAEAIALEGKHFRRDIGWRELART